MRYIARFVDGDSVQTFKDQFDGDILVEFALLKMLVLELTDDNSAYSKDDLEDFPGVLYIKEDLIVALDDKTPINEKQVNKQKVDAYGSTLLGTVSGTTEYITHLEILNSQNYEYATDTHDYTTTASGKNVDCFILDTGILSNNYFLSNRVSKTDFSTTINVEGTNQEDNDGHGTICAMLIAGDEYGVAIDTNLYSLKVLNSSGTGSFSTIIAAIDNVLKFHSNKINNNPSIINMSLGYVPSPESPVIHSDFTSNDDNPFKDAIKEAITSGIHVVLAAGNGFNSDSVHYGPMLSVYSNGSLNLSPEESGNNDPGQGIPIVVGSLDSASAHLNSSPNIMSSFSNYGKGNTLNSTGGQLLMPRWNTTQSMVDSNDGNYFVDEENGTSFSAPIVTGLLCMHLEKNPNATPLEARNWLLQTASSNQIDNLFEYTSIESTFDVSWNKESEILIYETNTPGVNLTETASLNSVVQILRTSVNDISDVEDNIAQLNLVNEDWWNVVSVSEQKLKLTPFTTGQDISYDVDDFNLSYEGQLKIANLVGTHESSDGVKFWQRMSTENRLYDENTSISVYLGALEQTNNIRAFNPYQIYNPVWGANEELDLNSMFSDSPLLNVKLETSRGEQPMPITFKLVAGNFPTGVALNEDGTFSKSIDFERSVYEHGSVIIEISSEYSSPFAKVYKVIDNGVPTKMTTTEITKDGFVWMGSECDQTTNITLSTQTSLIKEVIRVRDNKCEVWRNDMPTTLTPFESIEVGNIYYIKLVDEQAATLADVFRDNQNMLIISC